MRGVAAILLLVSALTLSGARAQDRINTADCAVPEELIQDEPQLPATAARLRQRAPLMIAAIGGSSTVGNAAGGGDAAYPHQVELALRARFPDAPIQVANKGAQRQVARQMVERFERDLLPLHPTLVLWEVGTTDAVRQTERDEFASTLAEGIDWLHQHEMEVMLIDMQFSPDTSAVINFQPYLDTIRQAASLSQTYLFSRYDVMKYWSDNGVFNFADVPKQERKEFAARVYACLGARLAEAVAYAAR